MTKLDIGKLIFAISPIDNKEEYEISAYEMEQTVGNCPSLNMHWLQSFSHIQGIDIVQRQGPVDLILGVQYSRPHAEQEVRQ